MEAENEQERDWSSLPPEILNLIAKRLHKIIDFVRFRAVCVAWRFAAAIADLPLQFPWMVEVNYIREEQTDLVFYSIISDEFYTICAPKLVGKFFLSSFQGYLDAFTVGNSTYDHSLVNPLNNHEIRLPTCYNLPSSFRFGVNQIGEYEAYCVLLSPSRSEYKFFSCRLHQDYWCELNLVCNYIDIAHFYLKGMIFSVNKKTGITEVTNITTGELTYVVPPVEGHLTAKRFLFLEAFGDILGVYIHGYYAEESMYNVHHLDINSSGSPCWAKVKNIGKHAIFIDLYSGFVLKANDLTGIKENCIYLLKGKYVGTDGDLVNELSRIDIETGATEYIQCPLKEVSCWFVPNLCHL